VRDYWIRLNPSPSVSGLSFLYATSEANSLVMPSFWVFLFFPNYKAFHVFLFAQLVVSLDCVFFFFGNFELNFDDSSATNALYCYVYVFLGRFVVSIDDL